MRKRGNLHIALVLVVAMSASARLEAQATWDLAADWSDACNPNGPWSYNVGPSAITTHVENWGDSKNPAWVASDSDRGFDCGWAKVAPGGLGDSLHGDFEVGTILVHSNDPLVGIGSDPTNVTWTSPVAGLVRVSGETWFALPNHGAHNGRSNRWRLLHNKSVRANGVVGDDDPFDSSHPAAFEVLALVSVGDVIEFEVDRLSVLGTFSAVRLSICEFKLTQTAWDLAQDWSDNRNPNGVWGYNAGARQLYNHFGLDSRLKNPGWSPDADGVGHIPIWFRLVPGGIGRTNVDALPGTVVCHSNDPSSGTDIDMANVTWTSPVSSSMRVSGRTWLCNNRDPHQAGRGNRWRLMHDSTLLADGVTQDGDAFDNEHPARFEVTVEVVPGDTIKLEFERVSFCGTLSAVCLSIELAGARRSPAESTPPPLLGH